MLVTDTAPSRCVSDPPQSWPIVWPLANAHDAFQPLIAAAPAVTVTSVWKPPGQELMIRYVAAHPALGGVVMGGVVVGGVVVIGGDVVPPPPGVSCADRAGDHRSDIFWFPESFGWTPSPVSVAELNPVHWSTTAIGDCAVVLPLAHAGIALLRAIARFGQSAHPLGFSGMIFATRIFMFGLPARIWSTSLL